MLKPAWEQKLGAPTYTWLNDALHAIRDPMHKPHHEAVPHFDRLGAQMLITVTTSLIAYAAKALEAEIEP